MDLASGAWYDSATLWAVVGVIAVIAVGIATMVVTYSVATRRHKLTCVVQFTSLLREESASYGDLLKVTYGDQQVKAPTIVNVSLTNAGSKDIPSEAFDDGRPIVVDIGVNILAELPATGDPLPEGKVQISGSRLTVGPWLIRAKGWISTALMADGVPQAIQIENPLINGDISSGLKDQTTSESYYASMPQSSEATDSLSRRIAHYLGLVE